MHQTNAQLPQAAIEPALNQRDGLPRESTPSSKLSAPLREILEQFKPAVEKLVDEMGRWSPLYRPAADGILRGDCLCYYASLTYGHLLAKAGFDVRTVNVDLGGKFIYPINSHQYLLIKDSAGDTIVDAAYYQYLRVLGLSPAVAPSEDILVVSASRSPEVVRAFAELRGLNPSRALEMKYYHRDEIYSQDVYWQTDELVSYFAAIWDLSQARSRVSEAGTFAGKLQEYRAGKLSRNSADPWVLDKLIEAGLME
jgi:hypothetical protein